jgi:hypothetical protein
MSLVPNELSVLFLSDMLQKKSQGIHAFTHNEKNKKKQTKKKKKEKRRLDVSSMP